MQVRDSLTSAQQHAAAAAAAAAQALALLGDDYSTVKYVRESARREGQIGADLTENKPISEIFHAFCFVGGRGEGRKVRGREEEPERRGAALSGWVAPHKLPSCSSLAASAQVLHGSSTSWISGGCSRSSSALTELTGGGTGDFYQHPPPPHSLFLCLSHLSLSPALSLSLSFPSLSLSRVILHLLVE